MSGQDTIDVSPASCSLYSVIISARYIPTSLPWWGIESLLKCFQPVFALWTKINTWMNMNIQQELSDKLLWAFYCLLSAPPFSSIAICYIGLHYECKTGTWNGKLQMSQSLSLREIPPVTYPRTYHKSKECFTFLNMRISFLVGSQLLRHKSHTRQCMSQKVNPHLAHDILFLSSGSHI